MKFLIVGTGRAGKYLHANAIKALNCEVSGFVDINKEAGLKAAKEFDTKYYNSLEIAISDSNCDVVSICTGANSHIQIARIAAKYKKPIVIEKPLTNTVKELEELALIRDDKKINICAIHNHRFYKSYKLARKIKHKIGDIIGIKRSMTFNYDSVQMMEPDHWSHLIPGGRLFEANPHNLYLLYSIVGDFKINSTYGHKSDIWPYGGCDSMWATGNTKEGIFINIDIGMIYENEKCLDLVKTEIIGKKGLIIIDNANVWIGKSYQNLNKYYDESTSNRFLNKLNFNKPNIKSMGSGHYQLYSELIKNFKTSGSIEVVPFEEAIFTQKTNSYMAESLECI